MLSLPPLLSLVRAGVPEEKVISDYALSHAWGCSPEGRWAMRQALPEGVREEIDPSVLDDWCEAPDTVLQELFENLKAEHGSLYGFFDSIGIDEEMRTRLRQQLVTDAPAEA